MEEKKMRKWNVLSVSWRIDLNSEHNFQLNENLYGKFVIIIKFNHVYFIEMIYRTVELIKTIWSHLQNVFLKM